MSVRPTTALHAPARSWCAAILAALALTSGCVSDLPAPPSDVVDRRDLRWFLRRLRDLSYMPEIDDGVTVMASPWDRTGGNADCCDYEDVRGDTNVLLDVDGPGCIHRLFTGVLGPWVEGTRIQIFLDHASTPTFDRPVSEFFSEQGGAFPPPLMAVRTYAGTHFPIPYARHARVQLVSDAQRWGGYWQITYTTYPTGTPVETLRWPLNDDERGELERVVSSWSLATWAEAPLPAELEALRRTIDLAPGSSARVDLRGPGVLRELRVALPRALMNDVTLQIRWDGVSAPAMSLRLADLFGVRGSPEASAGQFSSLMMGVAADEAWCRIPMPYARDATLTLENRGGSVARGALSLRVERRAEIPSRWGRLHVDVSSAPAGTSDATRAQGVPLHEVLSARGRGKYVGVMLQVDWQTSDWWGEGDWLVWTDDDAWPPRYHGTGTEEYFNSGWSQFERRAVSGYLAFQPHPVAVYSFHLNDAFSFQDHLRVAVETVGDPRAETIIARDHPAWTTAAFWYAAEPAGSTR